MMGKLKLFLLKIVVATAILAFAGWILFSFYVPDLYLSVLPWMLAFFALVTLGTFGFQLWVTKKNIAHFARYSMLLSIGRLFFYSFFAIIYLASNQDNVAVFVVCLVIVYVVYTVLEVAELARLTKEQRY